MAMANAALSRGPTLTRIPSLTQLHSFHHLKNVKPFSVQTRRFSAPAAAKLEEAAAPETKLLKVLEPATAMGAAFVAALSACDSAAAAEQVMELAANDNRGTLLLLPIVPAIGWVLYNILQPALNQINRMRSVKGLVVCAGLGAGGAALLADPGEAQALAEAQEVLNLAAQAAGSDNRGLLLLLVVSPAIAWVLYNILQPALNQINRMRSG